MISGTNPLVQIMAGKTDIQGDFNGWSSWVVNNPCRTESNFSLNRMLLQL